jgi:GT2 family glycosyltransferase
MAERRPSVTILILNWNGRDDTVRCLESLARLDYQPLDIILLDNGSSDGSVAFFRARYEWITVIDNGANLGFSEGCNIGIRRALAAGADYVMLLNNDALLAPDALARLVAAGEADARVGILGPKTYNADGKTLYSTGIRLFPYRGYSMLIGVGEVDRGQYDQSCDQPAIAGHAFLIKRRVLERVGGLDPDYFAYYEEIDLCLKARAAGFTCRYVAEAVAWHRGQGSPAGLLRTYLLQRNQLMFARKNASRPHLLIFLTYFVLYRAPKVIVLHLVRGRFAELRIFLMAVLWHVGLFRRDNPLAAQGRIAKTG